MEKIIFFFIFALIAPIGYSQEMHEHPDHLKGNNSSDQYLALPYYNEACELYANGEVEEAKHSLKEAITKSFSLTEAQLFLGAIYYEQAVWDSAFIYLNSGIDFATKQKPHFFFYCFDASLKTEQYYWTKQNLKHFKKHYGKIQKQYEEKFPFDRNDFERYDDAIKNIIYNYEFWHPTHRIIEEFSVSGTVSSINDNIFISSKGGNHTILKKMEFEKSKSNRLKLNEETDVQLIDNSNLILFSKEIEGITKIYLGKLKGKKIIEEQILSDSINRGKWTAQPFYSREHGVLFFASDVLGSKDLFSVKFNPETKEIGKVIPLTNVNTKYDEINPRYENGKFYFSSNGHPGFGGFDLYATPNYVIQNDEFQPSGIINMGKPVNSGADELKFFDFQDETDGFVRTVGEKKVFFWMKKLPTRRSPVEFEISIPELREDKE